MKRTVYILTILLMVATSIIAGCAKPAPTPPAPAFEVTSLDIKPPEVTTGETVNITAEVRNIGGSEGTYIAILTVDGATVETKEVIIVAGASKTVSFSISRDKPGSYQVGIGGLTSSLMVKEKLVAIEVELKYDDGEARDSISTVSPFFGGHIVDFSPPGIPFTIKKVRIAGALSPRATGLEGKRFDLQILDKELKGLYSATYPYTRFPIGSTIWVEFEVPNIVIADKFYVHIYTDSPYPGLHIGADDSVVNEHSNVTLRTAEGVITILVRWPYLATVWFGDKSKVNWMIRVVGTYLAPEK